MMALVPEVHLFICLDPEVSPGVVLHCLDLARAQDWQQETVLVCDESWRSFVNVDQPVLFIKKSSVVGGPDRASIDELDQILEQLDSFEISQVTQIGELSWGRWLTAYLEKVEDNSINKITWGSHGTSTLQILNELAQELALDICATDRQHIKTQAVYIDPYENGKITQAFLDMVPAIVQQGQPEWINIIVQSEDIKKLIEMGMIDDGLVDRAETEMSLFNQSVLCFSDDSPFALTSRSYNVAILQNQGEKSLFLPGDISIASEKGVQASELFNILSYWKTKRLKELAFQWLNMGIEIECVEAFHSRVIKRNLLNYSIDLYHSQVLMKEFTSNPHFMQHYQISKLIGYMRKNIDNDPYSLSFSLKILVMIVERMISAARGGERLFQRLGSDYHRIIIGEALVEGMIEKSEGQIETINVETQLKQFLNYLVKIDHINDETSESVHIKESS